MISGAESKPSPKMMKLALLEPLRTRAVTRIINELFKLDRKQNATEIGSYNFKFAN